MLREDAPVSDACAYRDLVAVSTPNSSKRPAVRTGRQTSRTSTATEPEWVEIGADRAGQRLDNFLLGQLKGIPRSRIYRLIRRGEVRVNKRRAKPAQRLAMGDMVRVPPVRRGDSVDRVVPGTKAQASIEQAILYEDRRFLIVDKPSGMAVHGGSGVSFGIIEALRHARPAATLELVHRLDRETSGCLMIAKDRATLRALHALLRTGEVKKGYLALVQGAWPADLGTVRAALRKNVLSSGERMVRVDAEGKESVTAFRVSARFVGATLVEAWPQTGRTHQIRVHAAHAGHPIAGDPKYGDAEFNRHMRKLGLKRLFLHAHSLSFTHPDSGQSLTVVSPLEAHLTAVVDGLAPPTTRAAPAKPGEEPR